MLGSLLSSVYLIQLYWSFQPDNPALSSTLITFIVSSEQIHTLWTHTKSGWQSFLLWHLGSSWEFGVLLLGLTSVVLLKWKRGLVTPCHRQFLPVPGVVLGPEFFHPKMENWNALLSGLPAVRTCRWSRIFKIIWFSLSQNCAPCHISVDSLPISIYIKFKALRLMYHTTSLSAFPHTLKSVKEHVMVPSHCGTRSLPKAFTLFLSLSLHLKNAIHCHL